MTKTATVNASSSTSPTLATNVERTYPIKESEWASYYMIDHMPVKDILLFMAESLSEDDPNERVLFGFGGVAFTVGELQRFHAENS